MKKFLSVLLFGILFSMIVFLPASAKEQTDDIIKVEYGYTPEGAKNYISSVSVTIKEPSIGKAPSYSASVPSGVIYHITDDPGNTTASKNGVMWCEENQHGSFSEISQNAVADGKKFEGGKMYRVYIFLGNSNYDYYFDPALSKGIMLGYDEAEFNNNVTINGKPAKVTIRRDGELEIAYTFPALPEATEVDSVSISIDNPVGCRFPATGVTLPAGASYVVSENVIDYPYGDEMFFPNGIAWEDVTYAVSKNNPNVISNTDKIIFMDPQKDVFKNGHLYRAVIYLESVGSYILEPDTIKNNTKINNISVASSEIKYPYHCESLRIRSGIFKPGKLSKVEAARNKPADIPLYYVGPSGSGQSIFEIDPDKASMASMPAGLYFEIDSEGFARLKGTPKACTTTTVPILIKCFNEAEGKRETHKNELYLNIRIVESYDDITFNLMGKGSPAPAAQHILSGTKATEPKAPATHGYSFGGWYTEKACINKWNFNNNVNNSMILYAKWNPYKYTISFMGNGAKSGKMPSMKCSNGVMYDLTPNAFKAKKGYHFLCWNTEPNGTGITFNDRTNIKDMADKDGQTIVLYAQWKKNTYSIKFDKNGGKGTMKNQSLVYGTKKALSKNKFTRKGYKFIGWNTNKSKAKKGKVQYKNKAKVLNLTTTNEKVIKLYAVWKKK